MISIYIMNMLITVFLMLPAFTNQDKSILKGTPEDLKDAEKKKKIERLLENTKQW